MKLVYICNEYPPEPHGGIGITVRIWAQNMVARGHEVHVLGIYNGQSYKKEHRENDHGAIIVRIPIPRFKFGWLVARYLLFRCLRTLVDQDGVDLVELPDYQWMAAGWPRLSIPLVTRFHGSNTYNRLEQGMSISKKQFWFEKRSITRSNFYAASSAYTAHRSEEIYSLPSGCVQPIYPPIEAYTGVDQNERSKNRVIFSGSLVERKGVVSLIKAWPAVIQEHPTAELHIYGKDGRAPDGTPMTEYLQGILSQDAKHSVYFHGHIERKNLWQELAIARVAVFPSHSETFGNAPAEAMSTGCPTIYTKKSCGSEVIEHEVDGLLVDPDDIGDISASIVRLLADDALSSRIGKIGWQKVRTKFSLYEIISQNENFYRYCIDSFHG